MQTELVDVVKGAATAERLLTDVQTLCNGDVDSVLNAFSESSKESIRIEWLNFCTRNPGAARKLCFEIRKKGSVAGIVAYYLSKTLYNLNNVQSLNVFAWCALSAVKAFRAEGANMKVDYGDYVASIVTELVSLNIKPVTQYDQILVDQILHYKTVCLASEDHLAEAFETWRSRYREEPSIANLEKLGWTLHDCLKQSMEVLKNRKLVEFFAEELRRLKYPPEMAEKDALLVDRYDKDLQNAENFLNGSGEVWALIQGNELSSAIAIAEKLVKEQPKNVAAHIALSGVYDKMGRHLDALKECVAATEIDPGNAQAQLSSVWATIKFVRAKLEEIVKAPAAAWGKMSSAPLFAAMMHIEEWTGIPRPSVVYSQLLRAYTKVVRAFVKAQRDIPWSLAEGYLRFVGHWDLTNLSDEDRKPFVLKDNPKSSYPSLAENVVGALYRCATTVSRSGRSLIKENPWVIEYIGRAVEEFPKQQWYPYYYGKLLVEQGRFDEARGYIIKIAQQKMSEFWVWQMLAETYPENQDRQLVCLCRAALCKAQDESFLVTVHEMLGALLKDRGMDAEALCEFEKVDAIRASKKWKTVVRGQEFQIWSKSVVAVRDNAKLYQQWAEKADAIVLEHLPSIEAIVTARYTDRERNEEIAKVWWTASGVKREMRVKAKKFQVLRKAVPGMPIRVWLDTVDGRDVLLKAELREGGHPWDIYPKQPGVLVAQDERRGRSMFVIGDMGEACSVDWRDREDLREVALATICELAVFTRPDGRSDVRYVTFPANSVLPPFVKAYSGTLRIPEGRSFGFVCDDIFVPEDVVGGAENGSSVTGMAARSYDRTKDRIGWKAVTMEVKQ